MKAFDEEEDEEETIALGKEKKRSERKLTHRLPSNIQVRLKVRCHATLSPIQHSRISSS